MKLHILRILCLSLILMILGSNPLKTTANPLPFVMPGDKGNSFIYTFDIPELQLSQDSDGFTQPKLEGYEASAAPGDPLLPLKAYNIALPPDVIPESVQAEVVTSQSIELDGTYQIAPARPNMTWEEDKEVTLWGKNADSIVEGKNALVYQADAYFPQSALNSVSFGQMRKWRYVTIMLTPLQYSPLSGKLRMTTELQARVTFERNPSVDPYQLQIELSDTVMDDRAIGKFYNFDQSQDWYPVMTKPEGVSATYNYVIITSNKIVNASQKLNNFITHKEEQGYSVLVVTENQYGNLVGLYPYGTSGKIRQWLVQNFQTMSIQYVLLIGDPTPYNPDDPSAYVGDVPMRMCWPGHNVLDKDGNPGSELAPTDLLYSELTFNWDMDTGSVHDEYCLEVGDDVKTGDSKDLDPDVYVGRIPVYYQYKNWANTLDDILSKTIFYQDSGDLDYRDRALLPMSFTYEDTDGAYLAEAMKNDYLNAAGYESYTMYEHENNGVSSTFSSNQDLVDRAVRDHWKNIDYGIVTWNGHGYSQGTVIGFGDHPGGTLIDIGDTILLDLGDDHPAIVFQGGCDTGHPEDPDNMAYSLLKYGAIATVSASRGAFGRAFRTPSRAEASYFDLAYYFMGRVVNNESVGQALADEKYAMSQASDWKSRPSHIANWIEFNLYGDPSLKISDGKDWLPSEPTNLTATPISSTSIKLHWTDTSDNETGFIIERTTNPSVAWMQVKTVGYKYNEWVDNGLSCGSHYYYRIQSYNGKGGSGFSNQVDVIIDAPDSFENDDTYANAKLLIPSGSSSSGQTHTFGHNNDIDWIKFYATWGKSYNISTSNLGANSDTIIELYDITGQGLLASSDNCIGPGKASCINDWVAPPSGVYYIKVTNKTNGGGCSGYNYDLMVQETGAAAWPAQPTNLFATPVSHCQIDLSWVSNSTNEQGFEIEHWGWHNIGYGSYGMTSWYNFASVGPGVTHYSATGLNCNQTHQFRVRAFNADGKSFYSDFPDATTSTADSYETNNSYSTAKTISVNGTPQVHNFHDLDDQDWAKFSAYAGEVYTITTSNLGDSNDTIMSLYDTNGITQLEWNDDCGGLGSCINQWVAPKNGTYYIQVNNIYSEGGCPGYQYTLSVTGTANSTLLARPDNIWTSSSTVSTIGLKWLDENTSPHSYYVERWQPVLATGNWQQVGIAGQGLISKSSSNAYGISSPNDGTASFGDANLVCNTTYKYRIAAFDDQGKSAYSDIYTATTSLWDAYEPDNDYSHAVDLYENSEPQYHNLGPDMDYDWLRFYAVASEVYTVTTSQFTHSDIYTPTMELYGNPGASPILSTQQCGSDDRSLCINGWTAPSTMVYYLRISGQGGCPGHDYSLSFVDSHNVEYLPPAPSDFTGVVASANEIDLTWTYTETNITGFRIQQLMGNAWMQVANLGYGVNEFSTSDLACGLPYQYRIYAYNGNGKSPYVTLDEITMTECVYPQETIYYLPMFLPMSIH